MFNECAMKTTLEIVPKLLKDLLLSFTLNDIVRLFHYHFDYKETIFGSGLTVQTEPLNVITFEPDILSH